MNLLYEHDELVGKWVAQRIPQMHGNLWAGPSACVGVVNGSELIAGVVWHNWVPAYRSIEVSFAADTPKWATRSIVCDILTYPFVIWGCNRINAFTEGRNEKAQKLLGKLGFVREGVMRQGFGDQDAVIMGLMAEDWWRGPYGAREIARKRKAA